jgi:hypothetical protein
MPSILEKPYLHLVEPGIILPLSLSLLFVTESGLTETCLSRVFLLHLHYRQFPWEVRNFLVHSITS